MLLKPGLLKFKGEGAELGHSLASSPGPVSVVMTVGGQRFCAEFGGSNSFTPDSKFKAKQAPAPASCPAP